MKKTKTKISELKITGWPTNKGKGILLNYKEFIFIVKKDGNKIECNHEEFAMLLDYNDLFDYFYVSKIEFI